MIRRSDGPLEVPTRAQHEVEDHGTSHANILKTIATVHDHTQDTDGITTTGTTLATIIALVPPVMLHWL